MKRTAKSILAFLSAALMLPGCAGYDESPVALTPEGETTEVTISFGTKDPTVPTRANAVSQAAVYLFGQDVSDTYHTTGYSITSPYFKTTLRVTPGTYDVYIAANVPGLTGTETKAELDALYLPFTEQTRDEAMPMSYKGTATVTKGGANEVKVEVERALAYLGGGFHSHVQPSINFCQLWICNIPDRYFVFSPDADKVHPEGVQYWDMLAYEQKNMVSLSINPGYFPENRQGYKLSITDETDRNAANAPGKATYFMLRGESPEYSNLYWNIYAGANATYDFNVRRNHKYIYSVNIKGTNPQDMRIERYDLELTASSLLQAGYLTADETLQVDIACIGDIADGNLNYTVEMVEGMRGDLTINGVPAVQYGSTAVPVSTSGIATMRMRYTGSDPFPDNSLLEFFIVVTDKYGYENRYPFSYKLANLLKIYSDTSLGGRFDSSGAAFTIRENDNGRTCTKFGFCEPQIPVVYSKTENVTLTGYYDPDKGTEITLENDMYRPDTAVKTLHARIEKNVVIYDANGEDGGPLEIEVQPGGQHTVLTLAQSGISTYDCNFMGWSPEPAGSNTPMYSPGTVITTSAGTTTLYARWSITYWIVHYYDSSKKEYYWDQVRNKSTYTVKSAEEAGASNPGYRFLYWAVGSASSSQKSYPGEQLQVTKSISYYAVWGL